MRFAFKGLLTLVGLLLFASNPFRDEEFYRDIAAHEGFGTDNDSYIIGVVSQFMTTVVFFPVAMGLIGYGVMMASKVSIFPCIPRNSWSGWLWAIMASGLGIIMVMIESDYVSYCARHSHHWDTIGVSCAYIMFIYVWWCCSLDHGEVREKPSPDSIAGRLAAYLNE